MTESIERGISVTMLPLHLSYQSGDSGCQSPCPYPLPWTSNYQQYHPLAYNNKVTTFLDGHSSYNSEKC